MSESEAIRELSEAVASLITDDGWKYWSRRKPCSVEQMGLLELYDALLHEEINALLEESSR